MSNLVQLKIGGNQRTVLFFDFYWLISVCCSGTLVDEGEVSTTEGVGSATENDGFARGVRFLLGAPSTVAVFLVRLARFGRGMTNAGVAASTGLAMLLTAVTSVGIAVDEIVFSVYAACGCSNGAGASEIGEGSALGGVVNDVVAGVS
jgi:hypothetical protein